MSTDDKPTNPVVVVLAAVCAVLLLVVIAYYASSDVQVRINLILLDMGLTTQEIAFCEINGTPEFDLKGLDELEFYDMAGKKLRDETIFDMSAMKAKPDETLTFEKLRRDYTGPLPTQITFPFVKPTLLSKMFVELQRPDHPGKPKSAVGTVIKLRNAGGLVLHQFVLTAAKEQEFAITRDTKPADGSLGGVTDEKNPASTDNSPPPAPGTQVEVVDVPVNVPPVVVMPPPTAPPTTPPVVVVPLIKTIEILKTTPANVLPIGGSRTFQVGEVLVVAAGRTLTKDDFASVVLSPNDSYDSAWRAVDGNYSTSKYTRSLYAHTSDDAGDDTPKTNSITHSLTLTLKNPANVEHISIINRSDCCWDRLHGSVLNLKDTNGKVVMSGTLTVEMAQPYIVENGQLRRA